MWLSVVAWAKKHPALCAAGILLLVALGYRAQAKRLQTQRDRARHEIQDAIRATRIDEADRRAEEAKERGDKIASRRAVIDKRSEEKLRKEENRHQTALEKIKTEHEEKSKDSNLAFVRKRVRRGAAVRNQPSEPSAD